MEEPQLTLAIPEDVVAFSKIAESVVAELKLNPDPTPYIAFLTHCLTVDALPTPEHEPLMQVFIKDATVALLRHEKLDGALPDGVNAYVLDAIKYCAGGIQRDCVPLIELAAECLDYRKMLYKEYGQAHGAEEPADVAGDTREWRASLDFADQVDAVKVQWDNSKEWTCAQIVETNPAHKLLKLRFEKCYETDDRWVDRFSPDIAPHKTQSLRAAALLQEWKDGLQPGMRLDAQDSGFKSWYSATVGKRREAADQLAETRTWQHTDSAQVTVLLSHDGREEESDWISVDSTRLARSGTRVGGGAAVFDDLDDSEDPDDPAVFACDHGKNYGCASLVAAVNCFGQVGGFAAIIERLNRQDTQESAEPAAEGSSPTSAAGAQKSAEESSAPVKVVEACMAIVSNSRMLLAKPFAQKLLPSFRDAVRTNLNNLSEEQIRDLTMQAQERVVAGITTILERLHTNRDIAEFTELMSLDIALKCFRCQVLEKKLSGFKTILELLDGVKWNKAGWVTSQFMVSWVQREALPSEVYASPVCVPIVERSADLMIFLVREKNMTQDHLGMVWNCSLTTDEGTRQAVYKVLKDMSLYLTVEDLQFILERVDAIPVADLTAPTVNLVFDLAKNAAYKGAVLAERALDLLWKWMLDTSDVPAAVAILSEMKLVDVLKQTYAMKEQREPLLAKCTAFISRSESVPQCMKVMWKVADLLVDKPTWVDQRTKSAAIEALEGTHGLLKIFFDDFGIYKQRTHRFKALQADASLNMDQAVVCSRMEHLEQIQLRLNFLTFVLRNSPLRLNTEQVDMLWDACIAGAESETEREMTYRWLKDACARRKATVMEDSVSAHLFRAKMGSASKEWLTQITVEGFSCFTRFFILANEDSGALVRIGGSEGAGGTGAVRGEFAFQLLKLPETIEGIDCLWGILLHAEQNDVEKDCVALLNSVHESLSPDLMPIIGSIREAYVATCMGYMRQLLADGNTRAVRRCVVLLETLTGASEVNGTCGLRSHRGRLRAESIPITCVNNIQGTQSPQKSERVVRGNMNVWDLRVAIGVSVKTHPEQIRLFRKGREILFTRNAETLDEIGMRSNEIISINKRPPPAKSRARLLDGKGEMVEGFRDIVAEWYERFSMMGRMTRQDCAGFIRGCRGDTCQWDDARVQAIFKEFDTDHDDILLEEDFLRIYKLKAENPRGQHVVWENLEMQGWGHDLKRKSLVYEQDSAAEEEQRLLLPRHIISLSEDYFELLFQMLSLGGDTMHRVWNLLMRLPTNPTVLDAISSLSAIDDDNAGWETLLDPTSTFRLLYALQITEAFMQAGGEASEEPEQPVGVDQKDPAAEREGMWHVWRQQFLDKGGFKHMHTLLMSRDTSQLASSLHKQCVASLLNVVRFFVLGALVSEDPGDAGATDSTAMELKAEGSADTHDFYTLVQQLQISDAAKQTTILQHVDLAALQIHVVDLILTVTSGEVTTDDASIVQSALHLWVGAVMNSKELLESFFGLANAKTIVLNMLFCPASASVRTQFSQAINQLCTKSKSDPPAREWFLKLLLESIPQATAASALCCEEFFELLCNTVRTTSPEQFTSAEVNLAATITDLIQQLEVYPYTEKLQVRNTEPDKLLVGIMALLVVLLEKEARFVAERDLR